MKLSFLLLLGLISFSAFANEGGIQDRKTKSIIQIECFEAIGVECINYAFVETNLNGEKTKLSRDISRDEMLEATSNLSEKSLDRHTSESLEFSKDLWDDYKGWWTRENGDAIGAVFLSPAALPILALSFVVEGAIDGGNAGIKAIANKVKTNKLKKAFKNQIEGDQSKIVTLSHKNYVKLKEAIAN